MGLNTLKLTKNKNDDFLIVDKNSQEEVLPIVEENFVVEESLTDRRKFVDYEKKYNTCEAMKKFKLVKMGKKKFEEECGVKEDKGKKDMLKKIDQKKATPLKKKKLRILEEKNKTPRKSGRKEERSTSSPTLRNLRLERSGRGEGER